LIWILDDQIAQELTGQTAHELAGQTAEELASQIAQEGQIVQSLPAADATSGGRATGLMESGCAWD
jgi:hypothetical protein